LFRPCPRDPVAKSTNESLGVGWPSRSDPINQSFIKSSLGTVPAADQAAYKIGAAWPFERMNLSLSNDLGWAGSNLMPCSGWKNRVVMISAIDMQLVGWPAPVTSTI